MRWTAIRVEGLGKRFRRGELDPYNALRSGLESTLRALPGRLAGRDRERTDRVDDPWFWALRDVTLRMESGRVHGIVGENGAGKTVLLKILSRVTWPTTGHAIVRGSVISLLETDAGFHPELTGRENVYFSASLMGKGRGDVDRHYAAITDFSGVGSFLDTPVKRFSSGMRARLALAIGFHLDPDILILDEALSVEDTRFRRRCAERVRGMAARGATVVLVSHDLDSVEALCDDAVWLDAGRVVDAGPAGRVVPRYRAER